MSANITEISDASFEDEVITSDKPVLVDFWAPWCGPCLALAPMIESLAAANPSVKFCKVNVDDNPETAANYGIRGIPTLIFFKDGQNAGQITGVVPRAQVEELIKS